jgi:hypothetical protein
MRYRQGEPAYLHAAPIFHGADFLAMFAAPTFGTLQVTVSCFSPRAFCEAIEKEEITHTLLAPTMLNTLTKFSGAKQFDLNSLEVLAFGAVAEYSLTGIWTRPGNRPFPDGFHLRVKPREALEACIWFDDIKTRR